MGILKFGKAELVNLDLSLRGEILDSNKVGAYCNTSMVGCNTRKYHGLLVVPVENMGNNKFVLLSALDESVVLNGKQFNLGIHCYGDVYEPKGHKYIVDFDADNVPAITYKVGPVVLRKSIVMVPDKNQILIKYKVESAGAKISLVLKPFLAFRNTHELTRENGQANLGFTPVDNGASFCMYPGFPTLSLQTSVKGEYRHQPYWYKGITYSNEYRRGFDCVEDLLVPGTFVLNAKDGDEIVFSASTEVEAPRSLKPAYNKTEAATSIVGSHKDVLLHNAEKLKIYKGGKKMICAGYSWLESGLLRETVLSLPGLTLYANGNTAEFEEILDNLIEAEGERLYRKTTQIEAPLALTDALQQYVDFGADPAKVWAKYGTVLKNIIASYAGREEVALCPNGLLWCQKERTALTWMNTYINGNPVNERAGFQVETNAFWYNALCFAVEMESKYGKDEEFVAKWSAVRDSVKTAFQETFLSKSRRGFWVVADYVDNNGQHNECRPNILYPVYLKYSPLSEDVQADVIGAIEKELVTRRGIRSLSPRSVDYRGMYDGSQHERDFACHNGCTFAFLLGPYVDVCYRMVGASFNGKAKWLTEGYFEDINMAGIGAFSELYDADPPHFPHGAISSATATAALLRCVYLMDKYSKEDNK